MISSRGPTSGIASVLDWSPFTNRTAPGTIAGTTSVTSDSGGGPLVGWLDANRDLRCRTQLKRRPPAAGELSGGVVEAITAGLGSGLGLKLADSLNLWLRTRRPGVKITVTRSDTGTTVSVDIEHSADPQAVLRDALRDADE